MFKQSLLIVIAAGAFFIAASGNALDFQETAFGSADGFRLDATLQGENLFISSYNQASGDLRFTEKVDGSWTTVTVQASVIDVLAPDEAETSIVIDDDGDPHIFYHHDYDNELRHAYRDDGNWTIEVIDTNGSTGGFPEAIRCGANTFCVCYKDLSNGNAMLATGTTGNWITTTIDNSADNVGGYCDIALHPSGDLIVAYLDSTAEAPKVATRTDGVWGIVSLDQGGVGFGQWNNLAIDSDGTVFLISSGIKGNDGAESDTGLYQSRRNSNGTWTIGSIEGSYYGGYPSMAFDSRGRYVIVYRYLRYSALFGHAANIRLLEELADGSSTSSTIDGSPFCLGSFLSMKALRTPTDRTLLVYFRSYGACGGNTSQIVIKEAAAPPPDPDPTPTPTPAPEPDDDPPAEEPPSDPTPNPPPSEDDPLVSLIGISTSFNAASGQLSVEIESDTELSNACALALDFSATRAFTQISSLDLLPTVTQPIRVTGGQKKKVRGKARKAGSIFVRARYTCEGSPELLSEISTFRARTTSAARKNSEPKAAWIERLVAALRVGE